MTIDKDFLLKFTHIDEQDEYKRNDSIQIGFEQELKSITVCTGDSARFEAKIRLISISSYKTIDRSLLHIEWRLNDICIKNDNNFKYQFGSIPEENRYWMDIQHCQQQDEKVYTIYIGYDNETLHDESSAYLFVNNVTTEIEEQSIQTIQKGLTTDNTWSLTTSFNRCIPPTITRSLQPTYKYYPGEQLHFLIEYITPSDECHCTWQVQYLNDQTPRPIEHGFVVNADCSSILIIESITSKLQGLYTFYVENVYGRAMTQTIVIVNANNIDDTRREYQEIENEKPKKTEEYRNDYHRFYSNGSYHKSTSTITDTSSSESSEYEELKIQIYNGKSPRSMSFTDEKPTLPLINEEQLNEEKQHMKIDILNGKDLYGQRHITYFDPSIKFQHVEPIEQFENDDIISRIPMNNYQIKNERDSTVRIKFELPPPPPIDDIQEEHIYEDIPNIIPNQEISTTHFIQQQSTPIQDNHFSTTEQLQFISSSPNSLDEVLHNVEQWSDIIVDNDTRLPSSPRRISQILHLLPSTNEYVDEPYMNHRLDINSTNILNLSLIDKSIQEIPLDMNLVVYEQPNEIEDQSILNIQSNTLTTNEIIVDEYLINVDKSDCIECLQSFENEILTSQIELSELSNESYDQLKFVNVDNQITSIMKQQEENKTLISTYLSNVIDQVIEKIHVGDELFEAKKTFIIDIQAPNEQLLSTNNIDIDLLLNQLDNNSSIQSTSFNLLPIEPTLSNDIIDKEILTSNIHKIEETYEILSNKIVDYIDIPTCKTYLDDQKPEAIIITTEEISTNNSSEYFPMSNIQIESVQTTQDIRSNEQSSIIYRTIINEKLPSESLESLSVPAQLDLLPLATMPDQTTNIDEQRIPDRIVQDVLSASLKPRKVTHIEGTTEIIPIILSSSTDNSNQISFINDYDEFFDVESEFSNEMTKTDVILITSLEKPPITLAVAEKLQHDAAIDDFNEIKLDLTLTKKLISVENFTSIEDEMNTLISLPSEITEKEEQTIENLQQIDSNKKSKLIKKKKQIVLQSPVEENQKLLLTEESKSIDEQMTTTTTTTEAITSIDQNIQETISSEFEKQNSSEDISDLQKISDGKKNEQIIIEKSTSIESFNQKQIDQDPSSEKLSIFQQESLQIEAIQISSPNVSITHVEQELIRPKFSLRLKPTTIINNNDKLQLEVHFIGQPEPKVTWYFKSNVLVPSSNVHIDQSHDIHTFSSILTIDKINSNYDGKFKVIIKNELGEAVSAAQVNVKRECVALQLHVPMKKTIINNTSMSSNNDNNYILSSNKNNGESEKMLNETSNATVRRPSYSTLVIPEGKPSFPQALENELFINEDDPLTLECVIAGNPLPELIWIHNDRKIVIGDGYDRKIETLNPHTVRHQLHIASKHKKLGVYKAQAQNTYGHTISICNVKKSAQSIDRRRAAFEESELQAPAPPIPRRRSSTTQPNIEQTQPITQKPVIIQGLSTYQVDLSSPCALTCKSKYDTEYQWFKDGQSFDPKKLKDANIFTKVDRSQDGNIHVLNIKQFKQENSGQYELILKNSLGEINSKGQLEMKGVPPTFTVEPKSTAGVKGKMVEFNCRVVGSPKPEVQWFLNGQLLRSGGKISIVEERGLVVLRINNIADNDAGTIKCLVKNSLSEISREVQLQITGEQRAPVIIDKSKSVEIKPNESVEFFVKISGSPKPTVTWTRKGISISPNELYQLRTENDMYYLLIKKAVADVMGTYVITASNVNGKNSTEIDLGITGLATLFERPLRDTSVTHGRPLTLDCEVNTKKGVPTIVWMKNNQPIEKSDRIVASTKGNKVHVLTIKQAIPSDAGYYSVKATLGSDTSISDAQVVVEVAPTFVKLPEIVTVVDGQDCEINIEVSGLPPPQVKWSYLAEDLVTNAKYKITSSDTNHQLRIQRATAKDAGEYQVVCSNNLGRITGRIEVRISSPPVVVQPLKDLLIPIKRTARLETQIYAYPEPKIVWSKDAIPMDFSLAPARINAEDRRGTYALVIKNVQLEDSGFYVCTAQNPLGSTKTSATLTIEVAPVFLQKLEKLEGVENCDIDIRVQVAGYPRPSLVFSFNQKPIDLRDRYSLKELKGGWYVFTIANARASDAGSYSCTATNLLGQASCVGKLTLFPLSPPNFTKNLSDAIFPVGGILKADLKVNGLPFPRLTWLKDGQVFDENDRTSIVYDTRSATWTLTIRDCQEHDTGVYECRAKNPGGEKSTKCTITVSGEAPSFTDAPEKVSCLAGQTAVFGCRVSGDPYPLVVWSKGKGKTFTENTPKYALYYDDELDAHFFEINQCSQADTGTYTVTVQNVHGTLTKPVSCFTVTKPDEVIDYKSILRRMVALVRDREGGPDWGKLKKGKGKPKGPGDPGWQYQLKHFELTGDAQLKTRAKGEAGDLIGLSPTDFVKRRSTAGTDGSGNLDDDDGHGLGVPKSGTGKDRRISRLGLVTFTKPLSNITVHEGKNAAFECNVSEAEAPVTWYINDQPVPSQRAQTLSIGKTRRLVLKDCLLNENNSKITCALDEATKTDAQLFVKEEPFDFTDKLKNLKVKRGDKCELQCTVNKPNIALQWFKDGKPITDVKEEVDGLVHRLIIPNTTDADKGVYTAKYQDLQTEGNVEILGPPQIVKPPNDSILLVGQSVLLTAEVTGSPKPQVTWLFKGQPLKPTVTKHQIDTKKDGVHILNILKGEPADEGEYTIMAENAVGKVQAQAKVRVCTKPKVDKLADVSVNIGENARIQCQYSGNPTPTITWYKDGNPIPNNDQRFKITQETTTLSVLTINNTNMDDKGVYSVKLTNIAGEVEGKANLIIKPIKPTITRDLDAAYTGTKDEDLILSIAGTGNPTPTCQWFKNNTELTSTTDKRIQFKEDKTTNEYFLIIKNANQDDMGEYQAQLTNVAGLIKSKKSKINIQKQPTFIKKPQSITVNQNDTSKIECQIDALPQAKLTWLANGKPVTIKDGYETTFDTKTGIATLNIKNITTKHAGPITIRAENVAGSAEETVDINVRSAPILLKPLTDTEVITNNDATFTCEFQSSPTANIQWFANGKPINSTPNKYDIIYDKKTNQHKLIIKNTTLADHGTYTAKATNELGNIQTEAKLNVTNAPSFINGLQDKIVIAKDTTELNVKVNGIPQPTLTWLKAGKEIKPDDKKYSIVPIDKDGNAKLIIKDINEDDHSLYSCIAKNKVGTNQTDGHLNVTAPLKFIQPLQDTDVLNTQNATLNCEVQGIPKANVKWYFNDIELKSTQKQTISSKQNVHSLTVTRADLTDAGVYKAVADNGTGKTVETTCTLTVGSKPKVEGKPNDVTVNVEQPAVLECTFSGFPKPEVTWFKDNVPIVPDQRIKVHEDKPNVHSLKISSSQIDDKATYTCKAKNRFGEVEAKMNLNVNSIKPNIVRDLPEQQIVEKNKSLELQVEVTGLPQPQVKWFKGNDEINPATNKDYQITFDNKQTYTLHVNNSSPDHQGEYSAQAINPGGTVKSKKTKVIVQKKPEFIKLPQSQTVKDGQPVVFDAQIDAYPLPKVTWLKNDKPLTPDLGFESQFDAKTGQITLKHKGANPKLAGPLICRVENAAGTTDAPVTLDVQTAPVITKKLTDQEVMVNNDIRFVADITGSPSPKISWMKDDVPIKPDAQHIIESDGTTQTLTIKNAKITDEGKYRVLAENPLGHVESPAQLTILEHPIVDQPFGNVTQPIGSDVNLKCKVIGGRPKATITWLKNGKEFKPDDRHKTKVLPDGTCELSIKSIDETDNQDKYTLLVKNKVGQNEINSTITVQAPLEFVQPLKDQDVLSQSPCVLTVETNGIPKPTVKWFFNDQEIKNTPKTKLESKQNTHTLTLPKTELTDEGTYKCVATNPDGTVETKAKISVCTKPKVEGKVNDVTVQINEPAELRTKFSAIPKPTVTWYKESDLKTPIKPNNNIEISELPDGTSVLKIKKTDLTDTSPYIARATNKVGEVDSKINLTVKEIKPQILSDLTNVNAIRDEPAQFTIKATGNPQPTIQWFKNDTEEILPTNKDFQIIHDKPSDTYSLKINKCKPEHQGDYSAVITNSGGTIKSKKGKLVVTKAPEFLEKPKPIDTNENQLAEFHTKIDGFPTPKITWLFDGKPVTPKDGFDVQTDQTNGTSVLTIKQVTPKHDGKITVKAENPTGSVEETVPCSVKTAPKITKKPTDTEALIHTDAVFTVDIAGSPKPKVDWIHGGQVIKPSKKYEIVEDTPTTSKLIIHDVTPEDELPVQIKVKNPLGETDTTVQLKVLETPRIEPSLPDKEVTLNQPLVLKTKVHGRPKVDVQWLKDQKPITPSDHIKIEQNGDDCTLTIPNVKEEDMGTYTLSVKNKVGKVDSTSHVNVTAPLKFTGKLNDLDIVQGANGVLNIECEGVPKPKLTWYFNDNEIKSTQKTRIDTKGPQSSLTINKADMPDIGVYKVVADNGKEKIETTAHVDVCVKPKVEGKPSDVSCLLNETAKLNVKFTAIPKPTITWHKPDGTEVKPDKRIQIVNDDNGQSTLIINDATTQDSQPYTARATNKVGSTDAKINLTVKEVKPTLKNDLEPQTINVGDELVYRLAVDGRPIPTVKFYKDGNEVGPVTIEPPTKPGDTTAIAVLRIPKATTNDQGEYQASVENPAGVVKTKKVKVTVQQTPVFLKAPEDTSVSQGKDVTYEAQLSAYPVPKVNWLLNDKPLTPNADCSITFDAATQKASLTLRKVDSDKHTGKITCQVENPAGKVTHDAKLDVRTQPKLTKPLKEESVIQGNDVTLSIESTGNPAPKPEWYFNDKPISPNDQHYQIITPKEGNTYELKVKQTKPTDEGNYKVVLKNSEGEVTSQAKLNVHTTPVIEALPAKIEAVQDEKVTIRCKVSGRPKPEITFLKDKKDVTTLDDKERFHIEHDDKTDEVRLIISNVKEEDQGKYTVRAKNPANTTEEHTNLIVSAPLAFIDKLQDTDVISGQNLTLTCRCQGIPKPTIKWYQNDTEIKSTTKQKIESKPDGTQTLTINRVDLTDGGQFKVVATNPQGTVTSTCNVDVLMKPKIDGKVQDTQVVIDEPAELNVKLSGVPKPNIQWFKNGEPLNIDNKRMKVIDKPDGCSLLIDHAQLDDKGSYTLKATNKAGEVESPKIALNVTAVQPKLKSDLQPTLNVTKGEPIVLTIQADGKPKPQVKWFKGTEEIPVNQPGVKMIEEGDNTYKLIIDKATDKDQGDYSAVAQNPGGQVKTKKTAVTVTKTPEFVTKPTDTTVKQGETATIECKIDGLPVPKITLLRDGKPLTPKDGIEQTFDAPNNRLVITAKNARVDQSGTLTCKLENPVGTTETPFKLNVTAAPTISKGLTDQECLLGKDLRLTVAAAASPQPTVKWFKDNVELKNVGTKVNDDTYELVIPNVKPEDEGNYKAVISNPLGDKESQCKVNVIEPTDLKCEFPEQQTIQVGKPIKLECKVSGRPQPDVIWTKDGKEVKPSDHVEITKKPDGTCALTIKQATPDDKGVYKVTCKNKLQTREAQTQIQVSSPLKFNTALKDNVAQVGQSVTLEVDCEGLPKPTVKWLCNGQEITPSAKHKIESKGNTNKLTIPKVDLVDTGVYEVVVSNGLETIKSQSKLDVCVKPKVEGKPTDVNVHIGEPAKLQCKITASPTPTVTWLKDGQPLKPSDNVTPHSEPDGTQTLTFKSAQMTDKAAYTCQVTNVGGTAEAKLNLNVQQIKPTLKSDLNKDITAQAGERIPLTIQVSGTKPNVKWYKNGEEIDQTTEENIEIVEEEETYTFLIKNAKPKNSGEYQAVITNDVGQIKTKKIKLQVQKAPELKKKPQPLITVKEGEPACFECEFDGNPQPKVSWLRDGKPLTPKDGFDIKTDTTTGKSTITVNQATPKHAGPITLRLENSVGTPIEETVQLQVETPPQLLQKPQPTCEAHLNQTASIPFKCLASPKPNIKLYKNEIHIPLTGDHYELVPNPNDSTSFEIQIKKVQPDDEGNYRIHIENPLGHVDSNVQVTTVDNVSIKPTSKPNKTDLKQHETLNIEYIVDGKPKPDVTFMKDGKEVKPSPKTQITYDEKTKVCRLVTTDVSEEDQGTYTLVAKNKLGKQESEPIKVNVTAPIAVKTKLPETTDAVLGEQTTLTVEAEGLPQPKVTWLFNGQPVKPTQKHKIDTPKENPNQTTLTVSKLDKTDVGKYTAIIDNGVEKVETSTTLNVHTKPKLESKLEPTTSFNIGEQAEIPIRLSGENNTVTWYKDSKEIRFDSRTRIVTEEYNSYKLVIDDLRPEDKGVYTMVIKNKAGSVEVKTVLNVKEQKPQLLADLNDSPAANTAKIGEEFFLEIRAQGKPPPKVAWLLNGQELSSTSSDYELIVTEDGYYRIKFHHFHERYLGEYQAVITTSAGSVRTKIVRVVGQQAPVFTQAPPKFIQIKSGEKLTIECMVKGHPTPKVTWLRDGKVLSNKDGFEIKTDSTTGHGIFIIPSGSVKYSGKYECKVENQYGTHTAEINIDVLPPTVTQQKLKDFDISRGQEVTITVTASGTPLPSCTWFHNDKQLFQKANRVVMIDDGPTHILKLLGVELADAGQYKAVVQTDMGTTELVSQVTVRDVSDESSVPVDVRTSQGGSCTLECQTSGTPLPQVIWTRNGQEIKSNEYFLIESSPNGNHRLIISNAQFEHAGKYVANVKHKIQTQFMNFNVIVNERKASTTASATINLTGLNPEQQIQQIQAQIRPLFLHFGLQDIPRSLNDILFNTAQDKQFRISEDQLKERERLLILLTNYLYQNSNNKLGNGRKFNWPEVVKIIFYNRFPLISQTHKIIDIPDGYNVQINDLIQYSK
ncbi:unnamed protein product [Rotaria sordida]|uniref:Ig-like domain-containing protein n=1 Tax=Rotaria sordida TaxID=392033 RepID=A0A818PAJ6_9BILA|nr:unnamed protein product [Rotaria sordida]